MYVCLLTLRVLTLYNDVIYSAFGKFLSTNKRCSSNERATVSKNWIKQLHTLPVLHFNSCLTMNTVKQQHTATATSIQATKYTYRNLSAQRIYESTVVLSYIRRASVSSYVGSRARIARHSVWNTSDFIRNEWIKSRTFITNTLAFGLSDDPFPAANVIHRILSNGTTIMTGRKWLFPLSPMPPCPLWTSWSPLPVVTKL
jgi:hypothetical protein